MWRGVEIFSKNGPSQYVDFTHLGCSRPIFDIIFELYASKNLLEKVFEYFFAIFLNYYNFFFAHGDGRKIARFLGISGYFYLEKRAISRPLHPKKPTRKSFWAFFCIILEIIKIFLLQRVAAGKSKHFLSRKYLWNEKFRKIVNFQNWGLKFWISSLFPLNFLWLKF